MTAPDIFLSYNREDALRARQFADALKAAGFDLWWDQHMRSGESYDRVTEDALKSAKTVVVLWSKRSVDSHWVRAEATIAHRNNTLVPAMIEPCDRPIMFELTQTAELSHWQGDRTDPAWQAFVGDLRERLGKEAPAPAPAPEAMPEAAAAKPARNRRLLFAGIAAALLAVLGVSWFAFGLGGDGPLATQSSERIPVIIRGFETSGSDDANEVALANGITEELIQRLRLIPELQIATTLPDGGAPSDVFANAHKVEGTIRRIGDRYQATARLTGPSGEILWSQSFDLAITDLLLLQEQLARSIAQALAVPLDVGTNSRAHGGTDNPEAYALYLQGISQSFDDSEVAIRYLERAIALDPGFVKAQARLARTYGLTLSRTGSAEDRRRIVAKVNTASLAALEANPDLSDSQLARASYLIATGDLKSAYAAVQRASELDPGIDAGLRANIGTFTRIFGHQREGLLIIESRELIDPAARDDGAMMLALTSSGRSQESLDIFRRWEAAGVKWDNSASEVAFRNLLMLGREADAIALAREEGLDFLVDGLNLFDHDSSLLQMELPELRRWSASSQWFPGIAQFAGYRGHHKLAVDLLRIETERGNAATLPGLWSPQFAETRKTDAFVQLVTDLGFPEVWRESGNWGDFCEPTDGGGITCH